MSLNKYPAVGVFPIDIYGQRVNMPIVGLIRARQSNPKEF